LTLLF